MIQVIKSKINIGLYDEDKKLFLSNDNYKEYLNNIISKIKPDECYHIALGLHNNKESVLVYDSIDSNINQNTILYVGDNKIFYINEKGHKIQESYEWLLVRRNEHHS